MLVCSAFEQVIGQFTLREQGIGGNRPPGDVDRIQQGCGRFYVVGLFFFVATFGAQGADFFCV